VLIVCDVIDPIQGAILMRGYLERCNQPKVKNFISWVSPQMGVYGVPNVRCFPLVPHTRHTHDTHTHTHRDLQHNTATLQLSFDLPLLGVAC
jgi:hypothetical protein